MSHKSILPFFLILILTASLACRVSSLTMSEANTQATIDAAIAATATAQAELEAMVDEAVDEAVDDAIEELEEEYVLMTEEEFNQAIEEAVEEATLATEQTYTYVEEAASDGTLTSDEIEEIEDYAYYADDLIFYAEELIYAYDDLYAELIYESLYLLELVEEDLEEMANAMVEIAELTLAAAEAIANGVEIHQATINEFVSAAQTTQETLSDISTNWQTWADTAQSERLALLQDIEDISANYVPADLKSALNEALNFTDAVRNTLGDSSISIAELLDVAQIGANAIAGLQAHGGPNIQDLAGNISSITNNLALGQNQSAITNLGILEGEMRNIPDFSMPDRPEFSPDLPKPGGRPGGGRRP